MKEPSAGAAAQKPDAWRTGGSGAEGEHWGGPEPGPGAHGGMQCPRSVLRRRPAALRDASGSTEPPGLCQPAGFGSSNTDTLQELKQRGVYKLKAHQHIL